jgi:Uma2 family endonuclease
MRPVIEEYEQTKPATEWILGRPVRKVSPRERHALVQGRVIALLLAWADDVGSGRVGSEWDFRLAPPGEERRTLVPDVAFLSYGRIAYDEEAAAQFPEIAPDVAFEVLSPDDRAVYIREKLRVYLACGSRAVVWLDPIAENLTVHDGDGSRTLNGDEVFTHPALPEFSAHASAFFARSQPKK